MKPTLTEFQKQLIEKLGDPRIWVLTDREMNDKEAEHFDTCHWEVSGFKTKEEWEKFVDGEPSLWIVDDMTIEDDRDLILFGAYNITIKNDDFVMQWMPYPEEPYVGFDAIVVAIKERVNS